jgi:hypothetical protein
MPGIPEAMQRERYADQCREAGVLDEYNTLLELGNKPGFAAMLALQSPPGTKNTDRAFCDGQQRKMQRMSPLLRNMLQARAKEAGIDTRGKYYVGGLSGGNPKDRAAWVTTSDDVLSVCKERNYACDGVISKRRDDSRDKPPEAVALAPDIVNGIAKKMLQQDPSLRERVKNNRSAQGELREQIIEKHGRQKRGGSANRLRRSLQK